MAPITLIFFIITLSTSITTTAAATNTTTFPLTTATSPSTALAHSQFLTAVNHHFRNLSIATYALSLSSHTHLQSLLNRPITIFAPFDSSFHTCPTCSLPLIVQERSIPGLHYFNYLTRLPPGTKIETIIPGSCITVSSAVNPSRIFINGAEITHPDLFVSDYVIIHGVRGVISHLSDYSCVADNKMMSLTLPTELMLDDVMTRLKMSGYDLLSVAIRVAHSELVKLNSMTIFAVNDSVIFNGGHRYFHTVRYHVIPNQLLRIADLERFPMSTKLATLENGEFLTVTTPGGGKNPMRINNVEIRNPDLIWNSRIVVHELASPFPFPHLHQSLELTSGRPGFDQICPSGDFESDAEESTVCHVQLTEVVDDTCSPRTLIIIICNCNCNSRIVIHELASPSLELTFDQICPSGDFESDVGESSVCHVQLTEVVDDTCSPMNLTINI